MPLTKQIIQEAIKEAVSSGLSPFRTEVNYKFDELNTELTKIEKKIDGLNTLVTNFAGDLKNLQEDHDVLSAHVKDHSDRFEKLDAVAFKTH